MISGRVHRRPTKAQRPPRRFPRILGEVLPSVGFNYGLSEKLAVLQTIAAVSAKRRTGRKIRFQSTGEFGQFSQRHSSNITSSALGR